MQSKEAKRSEISDGTSDKLVETIELSGKFRDDDSSDESGVEVPNNKGQKHVPSKEPKSFIDSAPFVNGTFCLVICDLRFELKFEFSSITLNFLFLCQMTATTMKIS